MGHIGARRVSVPRRSAPDWMVVAAACFLSLGFFSSCIGGANAEELTCPPDGNYIRGDTYSVKYFNALAPGNSFYVDGGVVYSDPCEAALPPINDFMKLLPGGDSAPAMLCTTYLLFASHANCTTGVGVLNAANNTGVLDTILATVGVPAKAYAGKTFLEKLTVLTTSSEFADYELKLARESLAQRFPFAPATVADTIAYADSLRQWTPTAANGLENEIFRQLAAVDKNTSNITAELASSVSTINNDLAKKATVTAVAAKADKSYVDGELATKASADQLAAMQSTIDDLVIVSGVLGGLAAVGIGIGIYSISVHKRNPQARRYEQLPVQAGNINNEPTYE